MNVSIFATIMTTLTFAIVPWLIALPARQWMPTKQSKHDARIYRLATAAGAIAAAALYRPTTGLSWLLSIAAASYLTIHWYRYSRTPKGRYLLQSAKAEIKREETDANRMYQLPRGGF